MAMTGMAVSAPAQQLLEHDHSFGPEEIATLVAAFDQALATLGLAHRDDRCPNK
jgi:hypothetical protein